MPSSPVGFGLASIANGAGLVAPGAVPGSNGTITVTEKNVGYTTTAANSISVTGTVAQISNTVAITGGKWRIDGELGSANTATNLQVRAYIGTNTTPPVAGTSAGLLQAQLRGSGTPPFSGAVPSQIVTVTAGSTVNYAIFGNIDVTPVNFAAFITATRID
jgi:hypothetical protein